MMQVQSLLIASHRKVDINMTQLIMLQVVYRTFKVNHV